jgi:tRNA pseudouridine38-40 synthase
MQKNGVSVEQRLQEALGELLGEPVEVIGASRTDAGVHALGNVAVFDTASRIPADKFAIAINHFLPEDIRIVKSEEVKPEFHPRYCESIKTYEYNVFLSAMPVPQKRSFSYHVYRPVDVEKMRSLAKLLEGTHDFSAFCSAGSQVQTKVRTIYGIQITEKPFEEEYAGNVPGLEGSRELRIRVCGNGFLYNMVRIVAGTLLEAGMGRRTLESVRQALETGRRELAGPTAPANGLTLIKIEYKQP